MILDICRQEIRLRGTTMEGFSRARTDFNLAVSFLAIVITALPFGLAQAAQTKAPDAPASSIPTAIPDLARPDWTPADVEYLKNFHEDWTSLTLEKSTLKAGTPILAETDDVETNSFIRERYQVIWRPDGAMDLYVIRPRNAKKAPVILYLYSYPQDTERFKSDGWCTGVTSSGVAAVGFVSALTGHRIRHRPMKENFVSQLQESLATTTHDVQMILNYIQTRDDLDSTHIGMFGQGSGGAVAILASAADPRIKAIDVLTPWGDWPDWLAQTPFINAGDRGNYMKPEFLAGVAPLDPTKWISKVKAQSVRIRDIRTDPLVSDIVQEKIENAAPTRAEIEQYGDGMAFIPKASGPQIFAWLMAQLKPDAVQSAADASGPHVHVYPARGRSIDIPPSANSAN
jgi:hypothetical protein